MKYILKIFGNILLLLVSSFLFTLISSYYVTYDTVMTSGEGYCGDSSPCEVEILTGGFPLQYLYDNLGSSVVSVLSIGDNIHDGLFLIDFTFYFLLLILLNYLFFTRKSVNP